MQSFKEEVEKAFRLQHPSHHAHDASRETNTTATSSTLTEYEKETTLYCYEPTESLSSNGSPELGRGVDVAGAQKEFAALQRQLSHVSQTSNKLARVQSRKSDRRRNHDVEKGGVGSASSSSEEDAEPFDLEETLRGNKALEDEAGIKDKHIGVVWNDLTVRGRGGARLNVPVFPDAFTGFFLFPYRQLKNLLRLNGKVKEVDILHKFRGLAKPSEMVLVLGRPGSGCTTFLKVIANQRAGYTSVDGEVSYGPLSSQEFEKRFRSQAIYVAEDDMHHPTLTVAQTLGFALDTKIPGHRAGGVTVTEFKERVVDMLLKMFNIEHTRNTIVGNAFFRGVSGGERKRVSIAEAMIAGGAVYSHDNTTRGLDASTALDYARSLRIITNIYKTTTFVSLYQASENIYSQFDKVLVIDEGKQVFFGPTGEARTYFESLGFLPKPRQTTPDYLTGCTDPFEREYQDGRHESNAPSSPSDLVAAFEKSEHATRLDAEIEEYAKAIREEQQVHEDFKQAVLQGKRRAPKKSVYSVPLQTQIWALMKRQFILKWQDKFSLGVSWLTTLVIGIIIGTVWLQMPKTSAGAFTRGGVLFIALLFNCFQAFGELAGVMVGRPIVNKHRAYTFHQPAALWLAQIGVDLAFASVQILVFSIIVYFMTGLVYDAGAFFTFVLVIITGYSAITLFFRSIACLCPDFDSAIKLASLVITLLVLTGGYLIQWSHEQVWLRWIFYINALGLGFSAMMVNEFSRINLTCDGTSLIPYGPSYDNIAHQICTLTGSTAGTPVVSGSDYVSSTFNYMPGDIWRNWGIMVVLIAVFLFLNAYLGEAVKWGVGAGGRATFFAKEDGAREKLNEDLRAKKEARRRREKQDDGADLHIESKAVLTWENLCYDVPVGSGQLRLLNNVFGWVRPGELTALMGASGAGKTTLLDVLASRKNIGVIGGEKLVDGLPPGTDFQRGTSYAEQLDVHENTATVREAFRFSAELRQPYSVPLAEKHAYVEEVIALLEMEDIADAIIGSDAAGLAVEQRKRVTIGVELAARPQLLLFLDEPTSGLDSQSAFNIVRFLRKLAAAGQAILCTIHQPNASLFESFDRLLLLQKGGETVYFGEIGPDAQVVRNYFRSHGAVCPDDANPAEWMLDAIGAGQRPRIGDQDWAEVWNESLEFDDTKRAIVEMKEERLHKVDSLPKLETKEYATPLWHQIKTVNKRQHKAFWRSPNYGFTRIYNHVAVALLTGLMFLNLDDSRSSLQYRIFVIFQVTVLPALILAQVEPKYDLSRLIFYRESASKTYRQLPFATSMVLAEMPYSVLCAVAFFLPIYYIPGFNPAPDRAGYFFLVVLTTEIFAVTLGQVISSLTPSTFIAVRFNPFVIIVFALFCGVTVPKPQIPGFWRSWMYQLDPFTRLISGLVSTELHNLPVICTPGQLNLFTSPPGQTCGEYMSAFFASGGPGYLVNNATSNCEYCAYRVGDEFYEPFGISFDTRWRDWGILMAFVGSNLVLLFLGSRYMNFNKR